jgi:hypothetical protein
MMSHVLHPTDAKLDNAAPGIPSVNGPACTCADAGDASPNSTTAVTAPTPDIPTDTDPTICFTGSSSSPGTGEAAGHFHTLR